MYIAVAILAFGIMIATHELGHFLTAKAFKIKVNEFAVGMGPRLLKKEGRETTYSLRAFPIGGFCALEGEDGESEDGRAFVNQKPWKKLIVLVSGAAMNFLTGLIVVIILFSSAGAVATNTVAKLEPEFEFGGESGIMEGDRIVAIDGHGVYYSRDFSTYMSRAGETIDLTLQRDGKKVILRDFPLQKREFTDNGQTVLRYGISFTVEKMDVFARLRYSFYTAFNFVRYVEMGLSDLVRGSVGLKDMSGVVGIVSTINDVGESSATASDAIANIAYLCAFIAVNLAVMNLLPIPALDGGRIFIIIATLFVEKVIGRKVNPEIEKYINAVGFMLLMALMVYVLYNDVVRIIYG